MGYQIPLPQKGDLSIVLDGNGNPVLVIETVSVVILPFNKVSEQFAFEEGEGNRSLSYWRMAHENYFRRSLRESALDKTKPVVCERFKVAYHKADGIRCTCRSECLVGQENLEIMISMVK